MDCIEVKEALSKYQDNELNDSKSKEITAHLKICSDCEKESTEIKKIISNLKKLKPVPVPLNLKQKIMFQIKEKETKKVILSPFRFVSLIYTVIFLLFLSFGMIFININKSGNNELLMNQTENIYIVSMLAEEEKLGLLDIQHSIMGIIEDEVENED